MYTLLRLYILAWNNSPAWLKRAGRGLGLHPLMVRLLTSYRRAQHHPSEDGMVRELSRHVQPGSVAVDIGANFGVMTEVMARAAGPAGQVIAIEAHPDNAEVLRARCGWLRRRPELAPVEIRNLAINNGSAPEVVLFAGRRHSANEWTITGHDVNGRPTGAELRIPASSLDAAFADFPRQIGLLKIDVEGAEDQVFEGMLGMVRKHRPTLLIEFHGDTQWRKRRLLTALGYRFFTFDGAEVADSEAHHTHVRAVCGQPGGR
jgi:FkbM family methyltransferase